MIRRCLVSVTFLLFSATFAEAKTYIVVLSQKAPVTAADVSAAGGTLRERFADHLVVDLPPDSVETLRSNPGVKYLEVVGEPQETRSPEPVLPRTRAHADWAPPAWSSGEYKYDGSGNIYAIGTSTNPSGEGSTNTYTYDLNSRLKSWAGPGSWGESYTYDVYGNMTQKTIGTTTVNMPVSVSTNQLTAETYDVAGNRLTATAQSHAYAYDAVNMLTKDQKGSSVASWDVYTADDERIGVLTGDSWTWSLRGFDHEVLRQFKSSSSNPTSPWVWVEDYIYRGNVLLASERVPEEGGRRQFHLDHLGTPRMITSPSGTLIALHDLTPFGSDMSACNQETSAGFDREEPRRFTAHERDFVSDPCDTTVLDYMHARGYAPILARFLSADPIGGNPRAPDSFNQYVYAQNNPTILVDPRGMLGMTLSARASGWDSLFYPGFIPSMAGGSCGTCDPTSSLSVASYGFFADVASGQFALIPGGGLEDVEDSRTLGPTLQGAAAFADGFNPFGKPLSSFYGDGSVAGTEYSYWIGLGTFQAMVLASTWGGSASAETVTVTHWGSEGLESGDWVMLGGNNVRNWVFSGKMQWWGANRFSSLASGQEFRVAASALRFPSEGGVLTTLVKAWLGQRLFIP